MYPQLFFSSETAKKFSYPYKMFWKFFVPLQNVLKIFRIPKKSFKKFLHPYTLQSAPSPEFKNGRSLILK